jgi:hypothetical protein
LRSACDIDCFETRSVRSASAQAFWLGRWERKPHRHLHETAVAIAEITLVGVPSRDRWYGSSRPTCGVVFGLRGCRIAVGTGLSASPPHRSQRAELPHWAPASGHSVKAHIWEWMHHAGRR